MCMYVIVWHKGSLTASNSLSSGSCCRAGAWWPIPPAPYFSFNDVQINSSTLFQNSSSQLILRPLDILTSTPPFHSDTRLSIFTHLPPLHLLYSSLTFHDFPCPSLFFLIDFLSHPLFYPPTSLSFHCFSLCIQAVHRSTSFVNWSAAKLHFFIITHSAEIQSLSL